MSKKNKKSSVKKGKVSKPAKTASKKVMANKKAGAKKIVKKAVTAKKAPAKKSNTAAKAKVAVKAAPKGKTVKKPVAKVTAKPAAKAVINTKAPSKTPAKNVKPAASAAGKQAPAKTPAKLPSPTPSLAKSNSSTNAQSKTPAKPVAKPVAAEEVKSNDPPGKFEMEYVVHSSAELLFSFLTEPSGLSEWFCDDVNIRHGIYTFFWDGSQQQAKEMKFIPDRLVRFQWVDKTDGTYFEFRIEKDELTGDISLIITDFAETEEERKSAKLLWDSQIDKLLHVMGAYF